jgi:hypothetical protein
MKLPLTFTLTPRLFALLAIGFVITTIVGTVSHEVGHCAVAKMLGYRPSLHYAYMYSSNNREWTNLQKYYDANEAKIVTKEQSPEKKYFETRKKKLRKDAVAIAWGGPLQTILTGTIGLLLLWISRKKIRLQTALTFWQWVYVFLAFFWSRQLFNCLTGHAIYLKKGRWGGGDEVHLSDYYHLPKPTIDYIGATIALIVLVWVVFYIIPKQQRFAFIIAGIVGSAVGFVLWMYSLGPVLLP